MANVRQKILTLPSLPSQYPIDGLNETVTEMMSPRPLLEFPDTAYAEGGGKLAPIHIIPEPRGLASVPIGRTVGT
jgi:hypothetical protein